MADLLKDGLAFLTKQLRAHASQTVTYARGANSVQVQATFGSKLLKLNDMFGNIRLEWTDLDFCIPAADLESILIDPNDPDHGDEIFVIQADQNEVQVYEVEHVNGEPPWRWSDPHQSMYRIHAKYMRTESIPY